MRVVIEIVQDASGSYRATCPTLPGCVAYGSSPAAVRGRIARTIQAHLAGLAPGVAGELERDVVEL